MNICISVPEIATAEAPVLITDGNTGTSVPLISGTFGGVTGRLPIPPDLDVVDNCRLPVLGTALAAGVGVFFGTAHTPDFVASARTVDRLRKASSRGTLGAT